LYQQTAANLPIRNNKSNNEMNHLLHQITWHQYLAFALIAAVIYYLVIILRCYQPELKKLRNRISGDQADSQLQALQYQPEEEPAAKIAPPSPAPAEYQQESITDNDIIAGKLKACIAKAADKAFAPDALILQLKQMLHEHPDTAATDRPAINHLVVVECEKTGTALLTEEEVDQWWER
jgi:hypothetical protein